MPNAPVPAAAEGLPSSRRALLAGLAMAPFVAAPVAAALADGEVHPDAALLALEPEFLARNAALTAIHDDCERINLLIEARVGACPSLADPDILQDWQKRRRPFAIEFGSDEANDAVDPAYAEAWAVVEQILAIRPVTLDGLRLKARVIRAFELDPEEGILDDILAVRSTGRA